MSNGETNVSLEPIAIIGMAGRFPGARNIDEFWRNLCDGVESVSFFTNEELLAEGLDYGLLSDPNYVHANAVLDDVEMFDASFFGFTPRKPKSQIPNTVCFWSAPWRSLKARVTSPAPTRAGSVFTPAPASAPTCSITWDRIANSSDP